MNGFNVLEAEFYSSKYETKYFKTSNEWLSNM